jgi:probable HAF family extracellular repeat protein
MLRIRPRPLLLACALAACTDPATAPTSTPTSDEPAPRLGLGVLGYTVRTLPLLPMGINDAGVIVGVIANSAVKLENGVVTTLNPLAGFKGGHYARAISNGRGGGIVGGVVNGPGVFWPAGPDPIPIPIFSNNGRDNVVTPNAINDVGEVVGSFRTSNGLIHPFRFHDGGSFLDIMPPGFTTAVALDVNAAGEAVGFGHRVGGGLRALRWQLTSGNVATDMGTGGMATNVRANGDAAGMAATFMNTRLWTAAGVESQLNGPQVSQIEDVSEPGRVVGFTFANSPESPGRPWTLFGISTTFLPIPDPALTDAVEGLRVNACGTIVGIQRLTTGAKRGLIWTRMTCDPGGGVLQP